MTTNENEAADLSRYLWIYFGPCLFITGILGNTLILMVMGQPSMQGTSTCSYLRWMAVADIFALITGMVPEWLDYLGVVTFKEMHPVSCKLEKLTFFTSGDASIWICVSFTIDRLMAVCLPIVESFMCKPSSANYNVLLLFLLALCKNLHVIWTRGAEYKEMNYIVTNNGSRNVSFGINGTSGGDRSNDGGDSGGGDSSDGGGGSNISDFVASRMVLISNCGSPTAEYKHFERYIRPWIALALVSFIPSLLIIICNFFIVRKLLSLKFNRNKIPSDQEHSTVLQMTILCLTASICFVVCNIPSLVMLIGKPYWQNVGGRTAYIYSLAKPIVNQIFYVNHSVNFFLYCLTGKRFRQTLRQVFKSECVLWGCARSRYDFLGRHSTRNINGNDNCASSAMRFRRQGSVGVDVNRNVFFAKTRSNKSSFDTGDGGDKGDDYEFVTGTV